MDFSTSRKKMIKIVAIFFASFIVFFLCSLAILFLGYPSTPKEWRLLKSGMSPTDINKVFGTHSHDGMLDVKGMHLLIYPCSYFGMKATWIANLNYDPNRKLIGVYYYFRNDFVDFEITKKKKVDWTLTPYFSFK